MKTLKSVPLELIEVEYIPSEMEFGKIYYSKEYKTANHLCVCGCGQITPIRIKEGEWSITKTEKGVTVAPSILQRGGCQSHYIVTNGIANIV